MVGLGLRHDVDAFILAFDEDDVLSIAATVVD